MCWLVDMHSLCSCCLSSRFNDTAKINLPTILESSRSRSLCGKKIKFYVSLSRGKHLNLDNMPNKKDILNAFVHHLKWQYAQFKMSTFHQNCDFSILYLFKNKPGSLSPLQFLIHLQDCLIFVVKRYKKRAYGYRH